MAYRSPQYLQITFVFRGTPKIKELEPIFDLNSLDWMRIANNAWIVWTSYDPNDWFHRLKPHLGPTDCMFIFGVDISNRNGWAPQWTWDWLNKKR